MNGKPSFALFERLLAVSGEGMFAFDVRFGCVFWNEFMGRLFGIESADVVGQDLLALFPFFREIGEDARLARVLKGEKVVSARRPFSIPGTNRQGVFDARYSPWWDDAGVVVGGIAVLRDVTEELRAAELLGETEARFRNMADAAPVLLWMSETDGLCTFFNQTWLDFTGRSQEEEWGVGWAEGVYFEDLQRCMDTYTEAFNQRRTFEMEYRLRRHDGEYRWLLDRGIPRYTPDGTFAGFIGSCIDITERRRLEEDLRRAVHARDEFLSIASHELKTPLTSLQLQIESLNRQLERRPMEALQEGRLLGGGRAVTAQTRRLADLVDALLDVSRINAGKLQFEYSDLDLVELVREAIDRWRPSASAAESELLLELNGTKAVPGEWDRLRLEQILNNLISNAVKYGAGKPIQIRVESEDGWARLAIADHGIGISPTDLARIFERFERAVPSRNYGGLGLGLWIAHELVTNLGGTIKVDSEPGRGSIFVVELPRHPVR